MNTPRSQDTTHAVQQSSSCLAVVSSYQLPIIEFHLPTESPGVARLVVVATTPSPFDSGWLLVDIIRHQLLPDFPFRLAEIKTTRVVGLAIVSGASAHLRDLSSPKPASDSPLSSHARAQPSLPDSGGTNADGFREKLLAELMADLVPAQSASSSIQGQYLYCELGLYVDHKGEKAMLERAIPRIIQEIRRVDQSDEYRACLLPTLTFFPPHKTRELWQSCARMRARWPKVIDGNVSDAVHRFLLTTPEEFRGARTSSHMSRIVITSHLYMKQLGWASHRAPEKRQIQVRVLPTRLFFPFGQKRVVGVLVGVNISQEQELFGQAHLLRAIKAIIPDIAPIPGSYQVQQPPNQPVRILYIEVERRSGGDLRMEDLRLLRRELPRECMEHIEKLSHAVFTHRNEEEVFRAILSLSRELRYVRDVPQMIIWFEGQDQTSLTFNVILLRLLLPQTVPTGQLLRSLGSGVDATLDHTKVVGHVRRKYPKEASVFRLKFAKSSFLRKDYSIDLHRARQFIENTLTRLFGEIRDYNGGLIIKHNEVLDAVKRLLRPQEKSYENLLEDLFYELSPAGIQSCLPSVCLLELFRMLIRSLSEPTPRRDGFRAYFNEIEQWTLGLVRADEESFRPMLLTQISHLRSDPLDLASTWINVHGICFSGLVFCSRDPTETVRFKQGVTQAMERWASRLQKRQHLRINLTPERAGLDPRIGFGRRSGILMKMLYEGLTRIGRQGRAVAAIAEHVDISSDLKTYTFFLRDSYWSNGIPLTSYDFDYAWKKVLSPELDIRFDYLLFPIKNARAAKEGKVALDSIGVRTVNSRKLVVELEHPAPYFLDYVAHWMYSPLCREIDEAQPGWSQPNGELFVCNGPFMLAPSPSAGELRAVRNPRYWEASSVRLEQIEVAMIDNPTVAFERFERDELDCLGEPLCDLPTVELKRLKADRRLNIIPSTAIYWYKINTSRFPFNSAKMRRAFALAVDRQQLISSVLRGGEQPAYSIIPKENSLLIQPPFRDGDVASARLLFNEALKELGVSQLQPIVLSHSDVNEQEQIAKEVARQWEEAFEIEVRLEAVPWRSYLDHTLSQDFQIAGVTWYCYCHDPVYNLQHLKYRNRHLNVTRWEHPVYTVLLEESDRCMDPERRLEKLRAAEEILQEEMPIIPIYSHCHRFIKSERVKGVYISSLGHIDFKWTHIE